MTFAHHHHHHWDEFHLICCLISVVKTSSISSSFHHFAKKKNSPSPIEHWSDRKHENYLYKLSAAITKRVVIVCFGKKHSIAVASPSFPHLAVTALYSLENFVFFLGMQINYQHFSNNVRCAYICHLTLSWNAEQNKCNKRNRDNRANRIIKNTKKKRSVCLQMPKPATR